MQHNNTDKYRAVELYMTESECIWNKFNTKNVCPKMLPNCFNIIIRFHVICFAMLDHSYIRGN